MRYRTVELGGDIEATLDCYVLDPEISTGKRMRRPAMLILPGGAYLRLAHREGEPIAARFLGIGYDAFVLRYSTYVTGVDDGGSPMVNANSHYPVQVVEAMRAMQWLHVHADELWIDDVRIFALGFSAGAHVLCSLCERFDDSELLARAGIPATRDSLPGTKSHAEEDVGHYIPQGKTTTETSLLVLPAAQILAYPMVTASVLLGRSMNTEEHAFLARAIAGKADPTPEEVARLDLVRGVRPGMPRTFIWQTTTDTTVEPRETLRLVAALMDAGVPCELHLYENGPHGMALADATSAARPELVDPRVATWVNLAASWLEGGI